MGQEIVTIMEETAARRAVADWADPRLSVAEAGGLSAVMSDPMQKPGLFSRLTGNLSSVVSALLARQRLYEHLLQFGDVLPVRPGQTMARETAAAFLAANSELLAETRLLHAGQVQFQLTISWDPAAALQRFAGELAPANTSAALAEGAEALRRKLGLAFAETLDGGVLDRIDQPMEGVETVLNAVVLVHRDATQPLDDALEAIDSTWPEGLRLKLAGPLPPLSFALVVATPFGQKEQNAALATLGLATGTTPAEIDAAFRAHAMQSHPDLVGQCSDMAALKRARTLLHRAAAAGALRKPSQHFFVAEIHREGEASHANPAAPASKAQVA